MSPFENVPQMPDFEKKQTKRFPYEKGKALLKEISENLAKNLAEDKPVEKEVKKSPEIKPPEKKKIPDPSASTSKDWLRRWQDEHEG